MTSPLEPPEAEQDVIECDEWQSLFVAGKDVHAANSAHQRYSLPEFDNEQKTLTQTQTLRIELGRTHVKPKDLKSQQVLCLDRAEHDQLDLLCDGRLIARGEVIVLRGKLCVRVTEIIQD